MHLAGPLPDAQSATEPDTTLPSAAEHLYREVVATSTR